MYSIGFCHIVLSLYLTLSVHALNDIARIYLQLYEGTVNDIIITLWHNFTIYQCTLPAPQIANYYHCYRDPSSSSDASLLEVLGSSSCHHPEYNDTPSKIMIENDHIDGVSIVRLGMYTYDDANFGIGGFYRIGLQQNYTPYKQILYFDTTRVNVDISDAVWENGTSIYPEIVTCDPTISPPSQSPTNEPTNQPTFEPTLEPSQPSQPTANSMYLSTDLTTESTKKVTDSVYHDIMQFLGDLLHVHDQYVLIAAVVVPVGCCFVCILTLCCCKKKKKKKSKRIVKKSMSMVVSQSAPNQDILTGAIAPTVSKEAIVPRRERLLRKWLFNKVHLSQCADCFIDNGYNSLRKMTRIKTKEQLQAIGITKKGHQVLLLSEIEKLRKVASKKKAEKKRRKQLKQTKKKRNRDDAPLSYEHHVNSVDATKVLAHDEFMQEQEIMPTVVEMEELDETDEDILDNIDELLHGNGETTGNDAYFENVAPDEFIVEGEENSAKTRPHLTIGSEEEFYENTPQDKVHPITAGNEEDLYDGGDFTDEGTPVVDADDFDNDEGSETNENDANDDDDVVVNEMMKATRK